MKKSLVLAGLILAGTSAVAMDTQWLVGLDASRAKVESTIGFSGTATMSGVDYSNLSMDTDDKDTALGLKFGAIFDKSHRFTLNYAKYDFDYDVEAKVTTLNYDYLFEETNKFTPFIGVHAGQIDLDALEFSDSGSLIGIQIGTTYIITDNMEFEIGVSYSSIDSKITTPTITGTYGNISLTNASAYIEADDVLKTYVGLNYKF